MIEQIRNKFGNQWRVVRYIGVLAVALITLSVPAAAAFADAPPSDEPSLNGVSYTSRGSSGNFLTQWLTGWFSGGVEFSPSGCTQLANNPRTVAYRSITSEVRAVCRNEVPEMGHAATLRKRDNTTSEWSFAASGQFLGRPARIGSAFANTDCENMRYQVEGDGWVIDVDDKFYYASNTSKEVNNPCNYP